MRREGRRKLTPPQIAERLGVSPEKVIAWIRSGELKAVNVATKPNGRPRWAVDEADLAAFERRRSSGVLAPVPIAAARRRKADEDVIEFF